MPLTRGARRVAVLFSGGLDSAALVGHYLALGFEVHPIYIRCGLPWESTELRWAKRFLNAAHCARLKPLSILRLELEHAYQRNWSETGRTPGRRSPDWAVFLPGRNLLLTCKAALFLISKDLSLMSLGTLKGNPFPDGRPAYFRRLGEIFSESFCRPLRIETPFRSKSKFEVIRLAKDFPIRLSLSCIAPRGARHCGRCNKCEERKRAFERAGVVDRTAYATS